MEEGLSTEGRREDRIARHRQFVVLWNSECDKGDRARPKREVLKEVSGGGGGGGRRRSDGGSSTSAVGGGGGEGRVVICHYKCFSSPTPDYHYYYYRIY